MKSQIFQRRLPQKFREYYLNFLVYFSGMMNFRKIRRNFKYLFRMILGYNPMTYPLLSLSKTFKPRMITSKTDICIEGFPRSANSFAYNAFLSWNPNAKVAHHLHMPMQIIRAVQSGLPCIVLIRDPIDALSSQLIVDDDLSEKIIIKSYIDFYEGIYTLRDKLIISEFRQTIEEFHTIVAMANEKYKTHFRYEIISIEKRSKIFSDLRQHHGTKKLPANLLPVPAEFKNKKKLVVRERLLDHPSLEQANLLYYEFIGQPQSAR